MATVVIQKGHCFRRSGATGTHREQEFTNLVGDRLATALKARGHRVHIVLADTAAPYPASDAFIALHTDGSTKPERRGASVGYANENGKRLAHAWKRAHQRRGFPGGYLPDNYTEALRSYYGYSRAKANFEFLAEHGTTTNAADRDWLFANLDAVVEAHVDAVGELFGHPNAVVNPPPPPPPGVTLGERIKSNPELGRGSTGGHVHIAQAMMIAHAAWTEGGKVDGQFGPATESALRAWQSRAGLGADGRVTADDWSFWVAGTDPPTVKRGDTGHWARQCQALMIAHACWTEGGKCDGNFGPASEAALLAWQRRTGALTPDGVCGPKTWAWLCGVA